MAAGQLNRKFELRHRRFVSLAPSAFIASAVGTHDLQNQILQCFAKMPDKVVESYQRT